MERICEGRCSFRKREGLWELPGTSFPCQGTNPVLTRLHPYNLFYFQRLYHLMTSFWTLTYSIGRVFKLSCLPETNNGKENWVWWVQDFAQCLRQSSKEFSARVAVLSYPWREGNRIHSGSRRVVLELSVFIRSLQLISHCGCMIFFFYQWCEKIPVTLYID